MYDLWCLENGPLKSFVTSDFADLSDSSSVKTLRLSRGHDMDVPLRAEHCPSSSLHVCLLRVSIVMSSAEKKKEASLART